MNIFEKIWKQLLQDVLLTGSHTSKDDADIIEKIGNHTFIPNPYANTGFCGIVNHRQFAEAVKFGTFDIEEYPLKSEALYDYVTSIEDEDKVFLESDNSFIYTYPERIKNYYDSVNQLETILQRLIRNKQSNRAVAVTLIPQWDSERVDIPCLQVLQCLIRDDELVLSVFFRSNDLYGAFPSNMMFLTYFGLKTVSLLKTTYPSLIFAGIDYHSSSLHIYKTDIEQAKKVIK